MNTKLLFRHASWAFLALAVAGLSPETKAPAPARQTTFDTPQAAAEALVAAAEKNDTAALMKILGPEAKGVINSGDAVKDKNDIETFAKRARAKMHVEPDEIDPAVMILEVGEDDWPTPIPIVKQGNKWRFDTKAGKREILVRRIGSNELDAIELLRGYVEAQHDYAFTEHDGSRMRQYAQKVVSTTGKQDGLSWKNADGTYGGPMGNVLAEALAEGHKSRTEPFNGYYFRVLTAQGPAAKLGARNYVVNGAMIGGFAMVAWPANYEVTGIQTFQVNQDGVVYQKDLGPQTAKLAQAITRYNPDKTWTITEDEP
jgi:hypothetical protein